VTHMCLNIDISSTYSEYLLYMYYQLALIHTSQHMSLELITRDTSPASLLYVL